MRRIAQLCSPLLVLLLAPPAIAKSVALDGSSLQRILRIEQRHLGPVDVVGDGVFYTTLRQTFALWRSRSDRPAPQRLGSFGVTVGDQIRAGGPRIAFTAAGDRLFALKRLHDGRIRLASVRGRRLEALLTADRISPLAAVANDFVFASDTPLTPTAEPIECPTWASDGTKSGTRSISLTPCPDEIVVAGEHLFFLTGDDLDRRLHVGGLSGGSTFLRSLGHRHFEQVVAGGNGVVFFPDDDPFNPGVVNVWGSDGTPAGTTLLRSIVPTVPLTTVTGAGAAAAPRASVSQALGHAAATPTGLLYFTVGASRENATSAYLWRTDGTAEGTVPAIDPAIAPAFQRIEEVTAVGELVYFIGTETPYSSGLWRTDGTPVGTVQIVPSADFQTLKELTALDGALYFLNDSGVDGIEVWRTDGTVAGTTVITSDAVLPPAWLFPERLFSSRSALYFLRRVGRGSDLTELWELRPPA